jgi:hypothetical protein
MSSPASKVDWVDANRAYLGAEFERMECLIQPVPDAAAAEKAAAACEQARDGHALPIDRITEVFGLSRFERDLLLLCAGVEMSSRLALRCADMQGTPQKPLASFGLAMSMLPEAHWSALTAARPLRRFRMIEAQPGGNLTSAPVRIDERILHYLAGVNVLDARLQPLMRTAPASDGIAGSHRAIASQLAALIEAHGPSPPAIHLCGDDPQAHEDVAAHAADHAELALFSVRSDELPAVGPELDQFVVLWERESLLLPAGLFLQCAKGGISPAASYLLERLPGLTVVGSREPAYLSRAFVRFDINKPGPAEQLLLWRAALGSAATQCDGSLDDIAAQFRLSARTISATATLFAEKTEPQPSELWDACRSHARPKLEGLAQRIRPCAAWNDLVLPAGEKQILRQLASQVRHRMKVYETWGFSSKGPRGLGIAALFSGPSGTGKTMAAEVLAGDLQLDLYRVDLASVVSKYIGETEKNLKQVFDAAEEGGVLLLFDEADALFGRRGEVRDSHDRYANIEVGYLLQRLESYHGLAILTTNFKSALDPAFQRRLRFTVNFPFPDLTQREAIWERVFPTITPTRNLDARKLAQLNVTGGSIRNIALNAAFIAAEADRPVEMGDVVQAAKLEAPKLERSLSEAELRGWL